MKDVNSKEVYKDRISTRIVFVFCKRKAAERCLPVIFNSRLVVVVNTVVAAVINLLRVIDLVGVTN